MATATHSIRKLGFRSAYFRENAANNPKAKAALDALVARLEQDGAHTVSVRPAAYIGQQVTPMWVVEAHHYADNGWPRGRSWTSLHSIYRDADGATVTA